MSLITIQLVNNAIVLIKRTLEKHAKPKSVLKKKTFYQCRVEIKKT